MNTAALDQLLADAVANQAAPGLVGMVADRDGIGYARCAGDVGLQTIFSLASCTKLVTAIAALQCVERGLLMLDDPVDVLLPGFADYRVLAGFADDGAPILREPARRITLRHLLTHTSGLGYDFTDGDVLRARGPAGPPPATSLASLRSVLKFDPGEDWLYGVGTDWAGLVVEAATGRSLDDWFAAEIFAPLGVRDTGFAVPNEGVSQLHARGSERDFVPIPQLIADRADWEYASGGGGLFGTAGDYLRLLRALLNGGEGVLAQDSVDLLFIPATGPHRAGAFASVAPGISAPFDLFPAMATAWSLGGLIVSQDVPGGRRAGSLGWAGIANTHYWVDREAGICAVLMAQYLPFADPAMIATLRAFEGAVYAGLEPHM